jgi:hypothetical protein
LGDLEDADQHVLNTRASVIIAIPDGVANCVSRTSVPGRYRRRDSHSPEGQIDQ